MADTELQNARARLRCPVEAVDDIFPACFAEAKANMSEQVLDAWLDGAFNFCIRGPRGQDRILTYLETLPQVARMVGEGAVTSCIEIGTTLQLEVHAAQVGPFFTVLPTVARRLPERPLFEQWLALVTRVAKEGRYGLKPLIEKTPDLLSQVDIGGLLRWAEAGFQAHASQPNKLADWFALAGADAKAALQRERRGTLFVDHERRIETFVRALWDDEVPFHIYSERFHELRKPVPYLDSLGFHVPDIYTDAHGVSGLDRYRAVIAHMMGHRLYSEPFIADNFNRYQHIFIEVFEDARVEYLLMRQFPGLRRIWKALHPVPGPDDCPEGWACIRHLATMLSRALLDPEDHPYRDPTLLDFVQRFLERMKADPHDRKIPTELGVQYLVKVHSVDFRSPRIYFENTFISYRDDNRNIWMFMEDTDDEDEFHSEHQAANPRTEDEEEQIQFARHHREWDYHQGRYQADWATVYEAIHPAGDAGIIDSLLEEHRPLAKKIKRMVEFLKPQQHVRVRYQEEGDELDLDVAVRAMIDYRSGSTPDSRIHQFYKHDGRDIAVLLLVDLSNSLNETPQGADRSILRLSQEAVSLLGTAVDALGDKFAIAGFASNTRHEVRYLHFKGFSDAWDDQVKSRLGAMEGALSTRMGAALRHGGQYLARQKAEKRLLLLLSDGEPHDVDEDDPLYLIEDTRKAVEELGAKGVDTYCVTLDPHADEYVDHIFGYRYTVIDRVQRLPERLPQLFMALTR
ncbi:nitric oxide reductase activation protein NorD [Thiohalomonas denitrificans]|uniref:nitric oxide reductase activation protein NorD n=1 Tax=Thiohalomonas denitrificans TaxID=415747 RepID=UPI0026F15747|nr:hypothetical protein [Thiohalomonas denitrificans]